jgi:1,2-phenylacetyl-CoA epoxidase PaaB subunit
LDPVQLLAQIGHLQEALWRHAVISSPGAAPSDEVEVPIVTFTAAASGAPTPAGASLHVDDHPAALSQHKRAYHRRNPHLPRWWRTRVDPFAEVWGEIEQTLEAQPHRTAKSIFLELQQRYPGTFTDMQLRTLQRRIARWRATVIMTFDDGWLADEVLLDVAVPRALRAVPLLPEQEPECRNGPLY